MAQGVNFVKEKTTECSNSKISNHIKEKRNTKIFPACSLKIKNKEIGSITKEHKMKISKRASNQASKKIE